MIGQKYKNKMCGSYGDISTFSFYANKHITTGEGGMILTNNKNVYLKSKSLRNSVLVKLIDLIMMILVIIIDLLIFKQLLDVRN